MLNPPAAYMQLSIFFISRRSIITYIFLIAGCLFVTSPVYSQSISKSNFRIKSNISPGEYDRLHYIDFSSKASYQPNKHLFSLSREASLTVRLVVDSADRDGDGIIDSLDKCPDEKGVIQYDGCPVPDTDHDGIADDSDQCPTVAGLLKYHGCLPGDRDGDKINDDDDKCPDQPGVARFNGCLVKDTDGDGVDDDNDKCLTVKGTLYNFGCPEEKPVTSSIKKKNKKNQKPA